MVFLYKVIDGETVSKLFESDDQRGWYDSPGLAEEKSAKAKKAKKDDDSNDDH